MVEPNLGCLTPYFLRKFHDITYLQLLTVIKLLKFYSLWDINPLKIEFSLSKTLRFDDGKNWKQNLEHKNNVRRIHIV